jgi:multiple sugar transport system substrate-binding protein
VLADFDTGIQQLASTDPKSILARLQKNTQAALAG